VSWGESSEGFRQAEKAPTKEAQPTRPRRPRSGRRRRWWEPNRGQRERLEQNLHMHVLFQPRGIPLHACSRILELRGSSQRAGVGLNWNNFCVCKKYSSCFSSVVARATTRKKSWGGRTE